MDPMINGKVEFLRADLELTRTLISLAHTEKELKNEDHFQHLRGEIQKAIRTLQRVIADHRIHIPPEDASQFEKEIADCQIAYEQL
jgi:hypothetical protein